MRLWTFQPEVVYQKLLSDGVFRCDPKRSENIREFQFYKAYDWLVSEMKKRIGNPPDGVKYPVWAWHTVDWKHKKPDLRLREFWYSKPMVCIEIEISEQNVLLSNEDSWHIVLNDAYLSETEADWNAFDHLPEERKSIVKVESWNQIFDIEPYESDWFCKGRYIQATFWELRKDRIVSVRHVMPKYR